MRYVCPAAVGLVVACSLMFGATATENLSITNYQFVSEQRVTLTKSHVTYRADVVNKGPAAGAVTATLASSVASVQIVSGQNTLHFPSVAANSQVASVDTFTILVDRTVPFSFTNLVWTFQTGAPVANAGPNQTARIGSTVTLDGSGSTNPSGAGTLSYSWVFTARPAGSASILSNPSSVMPTFVPDAAGNYIITLTVNNGVLSDSASVTVSTTGTRPVANAGPNQTVAVGSTVVLNGGASTSVDGRPLTYSWSLTSRPSGSAAALTGATSVSPTLIADKSGTYTAELVVNDGMASAPSTVTVSTLPVAPVANAGANQVVNINSVVQLNGAGSTDANGLPLTYRWSLITLPAGSSAVLSDATAVKPTFTADRPGTYVAQLIVNNGTLDSTAATATVTTNPILAPTANAGANQTVTQGQTVQLNGSGSDPQGLSLTYQWSLINRAAGSAATLTGTTTANPVFIADLPGSYIAQLIVNNGYLNSAPSTVTISTTCAPPTANPGANQTVAAGATVRLDGSASGDVCHDPLTYSWSLTSRPAGSAAALTGATSVSPTFVADLGGTYVVQLIVNNGYTNSTPVTVTISAQAFSFTPNTLNLTNGPGTLTLNTSIPAGSGGQPVALTSGDTGIATVPATVKIPQGATSVNLTVTPGVNSGSTTITAKADGFAPATAAVNVTGSTVTLTLDSGTLGLSRTMNGTINLGAPAPAGGVTIALASTPAGIVDVQPAQVTIGAGNTTGTFTVTGSATGSASITASGPGYSAGSANVNVVIFGTIGVPADLSIGLGASATFAVSLPVAAPAGGATVTLTSSDTSRVTVTPSSVFIAAGAKTPATQPQVNAINIGSATITASTASYNSASGTVKVNATVSFSPSNVTIIGANTQNITLNLSAPAPTAGLTVNLTSDNPAVARVPQSVTFTSNMTSVNVPVTGVAQGSTVIHASAPPNIADATAAVTVSSEMNLPAGITVAPGQTISFPLTLVNAAPANGAFITLTSSDPSKAVVSPSNILIGQGEKMPNTQPKVIGKGFGTVVITASSPIYLPASMQAKVNAALAFSPQSMTIQGTSSRPAFTLILYAPDGSVAPAPEGGLTFNVTSDNPAVAVVPQSVTFPAGVNNVPVTIRPVGTGVTTIRTGLPPFVPEAVATVTVTGPGSISIPGLTVGLGQTAQFPVTLGTPAPYGGAKITLASSDTTKVGVSASVTIPEGQTQPAVQPEVSGAGFGTATITASADGYTATASVVTVPAASMAFSDSVTLSAGASGTLTLNLSGGQGPANGLKVDLSSDNTGVAAVPASVTFAAGQTSVSVPVTAGLVNSQQSANITASSAGMTSVKAAVTVNPRGTIQVSNVTVGTNQSATITVTLPGAAPARDVAVVVESSDINIATATTSVTIPANSTSGSATVTGIAGGTANITAKAAGYAQGSTAVTVTPLKLSIADLALESGAQGTIAFTLTGGVAPAAGLTVQLASDDTNLATVSPTASFAANGTSTTATVTAGTVSGQAQRAHISASSLNPSLSASAAVTITPLPTVTLGPLSVGLGLTGNIPITLSKPSAKDLTISFTTSNAANVPAPASITIPANTTSGTVAVTGNTIGTAKITGTAADYEAGTSAVTVTAPTPSFAPETVTLNHGAAGLLTLNLTGGQAPADGLTINLSSGDPAIARVPETVRIEAGKTSATVEVTTVAAGTTQITAKGVGFEKSATATVMVPGTIAVPDVSAGLGMTANLQVTLSLAAPSGGAKVEFTSSDPAIVPAPASITIEQGQTTGTVTVSANGIGSATLTATATGYTAGTGKATVTAPAMAFVGSPLTIDAGKTGTLTLQLAGGKAPAGGLKVNLVSGDVNKVTVASSVTFTAGSSSETVTVTGQAAGGPVTITATAANLENATASVTVAQPSITVVNTSLGLGLTANLQVTLSAAAPEGGVAIAFATSEAGIVGAPAGITIPKGQTSGTAIITAAGIGSANITAQAAGYKSGTGTVVVTAPGLSFSGSPLTMSEGTAETMTLNLTGGKAPASGLAVSLTSGDTNIATVQGTVNFAAGATSASVMVNGVAAGGPVTITASAPSIPSATASVTVEPAAIPTSAITLGAASVGRNLQTSITLSLTTPAPEGGLSVKVTSTEASKLLVAGRQSDTGKQQVTFTVPQGQSLIGGIYLQGLADTGTVTLQASAPGYKSGTTAVALTPSGFTLSGPSGASSFTTNVGVAASTLTVSAVRLDAALNVAEVQQVRPGAALAVAISNSTSSVGTVGSPVTFGAGDSTAVTTFTPTTSNSNTGSTTLTAVAPSGYSTPKSGASVTAIVNSQGIVCDSVAVGRNLQTLATCTLLGKAPAGGLQVVVSSSDASMMQLSTTPTGAGSGSITITVPANQSSTPYFYVFGRASSGTATYTAAAASGFSNGTGTVTLAPSGFVLGTAGGIGHAFTAINSSTNIFVYPAQLDAAGNYVATQPLAGGTAAVNITVSNDNSNAGTVTPAQVTVSPGSSGVDTQFVKGTPPGTQTANLAIGTPAGYGTPASQYTKVQGTVFGAAPLRLSCNGVVAGKNLQEVCTVSTNMQASALTVTLTSDSTNLLLATNAADAGSNTLTLTIPAGGASATYYVQSLADSGTVTHTAAAQGYSTQTAEVTLAPSAVIIAGSIGYGPYMNMFNASVSGGPVNLPLYTAAMISGKPVLQALRGGYGPLDINVASANPAVGTVASPVTIAAGTGQGTVRFTPVSAGSVSVYLTEPAGFINPGSFPPNSYTTLMGTVGQ